METGTLTQNYCTVVPLQSESYKFYHNFSKKIFELRDDISFQATFDMQI